METITGKTEPVLIIEAPVRHGKSEFVSKWLATWYLGRYPDRYVLLASATARLAEKWGRRARAVMEEHGPKLFGVGVSADRRSASDWETTHGGGMVTAGVGGDVMGRDGHLLIVDDYIRTAENALSETVREKQWDWWQSTFSTRMEPGGCAIVMATRWHKDDLIGRLTGESDEVDHEGLFPSRRIRLPAIAEDDDELGRAPGEALWPQRWPLGDGERLTLNAWGHKVLGLEMRRRGTDAFWWNAVYQQRPSRHGRAEWPDCYFEPIWSEDWPDSFELSAIAIDPSKGKTTGDFSAIVFVGLCSGLLFVEADIRRRPVPEIVQAGIEMACRTNPNQVAVEANAFQDLLAPEFDRQCMEHGVPPLPISLPVSKTDKSLRISRIGPYLERHKLRVRKDHGGRILVKQLKEFPLSDHDDGPDALEMAITALSQFVANQHADPDPQYVSA